MRLRLLLSDQGSPCGHHYLPLRQAQRHVSYPFRFTHTPRLSLKATKEERMRARPVYSYIYSYIY